MGSERLRFRSNLMLALGLAALLPLAAAAHQPRLVVGNNTAVIDPEISKAYYGALDGEPAVFSFSAAGEFDLYVGLLVPDIAGARTDFSAVILKDGRQSAALDGSAVEWPVFHEEFAGDDYLEGPEYRSRGSAGIYEIVISNPGNSGKYVLAVGEKEYFPLGEIFDSFRVIPKLKTDFFGQPTAAGFVLSIFGAAGLVLAVALGVLMAWFNRLLLKRRKAGERAMSQRNLGAADRLLRAGLAVVFLGAGLVLWDPLLQALSGFLLFEALAGWCVVYSAIGRNTCPVK